MKLQPSFLVDKYNNSKDKWILPIPVWDNGEMKLRCYMSRKKQGIFTDVYTYNIDNCRNILFGFLTSKSYGQAYHRFIRLQKERDDFILESDHEKGIFTMDDIKNTMFIGKTAHICHKVQEYLDNNGGFEFNLECISESERKTVEELKSEIPLADMGYDY